MITQTSTAFSVASGTASDAKSGTPSKLTSDFETFLKMLTAQARYQDPLEPLDSAQYASQLAQFSMVEQQVQTNEFLAGLAGALDGANLNDLADWIGMDVRTNAPVQFNGTPVTLFPQTDGKADKANLVIRDSDGTVVDRVTMPVSATSFVWDGADGSGGIVPTGLYSLSVESFYQGELLSETAAATYGRVTEAQILEGKVTLTLDGGQVVSTEEVSGIRTGS